MGNTKKTKAKHCFELDNRQMIFVFAGFIVVCLFVFTAGVMLGSKTTAEKEVSVKPGSKLRAKIKAPSLLEDKKEKNAQVATKTRRAPSSTPAPAKSIEDILDRELRQKASDPSALRQAKDDKGSGAKAITRSTKVPTPAKETSLLAKKEAFFVQVASFQKPEDADSQAARLKSKGYKVIIIKADLSGKGIWYRVRLGPYKDSAAAKSAALKYEKDEKSTSFVTKGLI